MEEVFTLSARNRLAILKLFTANDALIELLSLLHGLLINFIRDLA